MDKKTEGSDYWNSLTLELQQLSDIAYIIATTSKRCDEYKVQAMTTVPNNEKLVSAAKLALDGGDDAMRLFIETVGISTMEICESGTIAQKEVIAATLSSIARRDS